MRENYPENLERSRVQHPRYVPTKRGDKDGFFVMRGPSKATLVIMASNGMGWEHVSVSVREKRRVPNWAEMCFVKSLFWGDEEVVVQYHPRKSEYVNNHEYVLHLWKPASGDLPTPPAIMVGMVGISPNEARRMAKMTQGRI